MWASSLVFMPPICFLSPFCSFFKALKVVYAKRRPLSKQTKPGRQAAPRMPLSGGGHKERNKINSLESRAEPRRLQNVQSLSYALPGTGRMSVCLLFCSRCRFVQFQCPALHSGGVFQFSYKSQQEHIYIVLDS
jgi:hypothetical protein